MVENSNDHERQGSHGRYTKKEQAIALSLLTILTGAQAKADQIVLGTNDSASKTIRVRSNLDPTTGQLKSLDYPTGNQTIAGGILKLPDGDVIISTFNNDTQVYDIQKVTGLETANPSVNRYYLPVNMPREMSYNPITKKVSIPSQGDSKGLLCDDTLSHCETYTLSSGSQPMFLVQTDNGLLLSLNYSGGTGAIYDPGLDTDADGFPDDGDGDGKPDYNPIEVAKFTGLTNPQGGVLVGNTLWAVAHDAKALYRIDIDVDFPENSTSTKVLSLEFQPHDIKVDPNNSEHLLLGGDLSSTAYMVSYNTATQETITKKYESGSISGNYEIIAFDSQGNPWMTEYNYNLARQLNLTTLELTGLQVDLGGRPNAFTIVREAVPADVDADGYDSTADCDDANPEINPGADELCTEEVDEDCDGDTQSGAIDTGTFYPDADGDKFGDQNSPGVEACEVPANHVDDNTDCDDQNASTYPGALEILDGVDNNCNSQVDEGLDSPVPSPTVKPGDDDTSETSVPGDDDDTTTSPPGDDDDTAETTATGDDDASTGDDDTSETTAPGDDDSSSDETTSPGDDDSTLETVECSFNEGATWSEEECKDVPLGDEDTAFGSGGPFSSEQDGDDLVLTYVGNGSFGVDKVSPPQKGIVIDDGAGSGAAVHGTRPRTVRTDAEFTVSVLDEQDERAHCVTLTTPLASFENGICEGETAVVDRNTGEIIEGKTTAEAVLAALDEDRDESVGCGGCDTSDSTPSAPLEGAILLLAVATSINRKKRGFGGFSLKEFGTSIAQSIHRALQG